MESIHSNEMTTVINMFRRQSATNPEATALETDNICLSYTQLDRISDAVALQIQVHTAPAQCVAIIGEPEAWLIAAVLGVMKAGGIMLLIDSRVPTAYRRNLLEQANPALMVFGANASDHEMPSYPSIEVKIETEPDNHLIMESGFLDPDPEDSAYIFFTSGSTGEPKGVLGWHGALAHFISWQSSTFDIGLGDRIPLLTRLSFDVVLRDLFLPLCSGATLVIPESDLALNFGRIGNWLKNKHITAIHTVPSLVAYWIQHTKEDLILSDLRLVFFAGEPLTDILVDAWRKCFGSASRVLNFYGPTETTLAKFYYEVPENPSAGAQPVGNCLPDVTILLLDQSGNPVIDWEQGEVCISTPYRSRGYINNSNETEKRFVKVTLLDGKTIDCYRTGDLGHLSNGCLILNGRQDEQVKINGVRIELNEVCNVLGNMDGMEKCVVLVDTVANSNILENSKILICFYVGNIKKIELRIYAQQHLPLSHIPRYFHRIEELPLNANGKLDKKALLTRISHMSLSTDAAWP